jgi:hypothetical protein
MEEGITRRGRTKRGEESPFSTAPRHILAIDRAEIDRDEEGDYNPQKHKQLIPSLPLDERPSEDYDGHDYGSSHDCRRYGRKDSHEA